MRLHPDRLDVVLLGGLEVSVAEQIRGDADLLGGAVDELRRGAATEQVGPDVPAEGLLGAGFDLLPDRGATHRPAVAVEPEVIPSHGRRGISPR